MSDLGFLAADCKWCAAAVARPSRARGQRVVRRRAEGGVVLGDCDVCREVRINRIVMFDYVGEQTTGVLLRWAFWDWGENDLWPRIACWHLAARRREGCDV